MHRDSVDRFEVQTIPTGTTHKRLGDYLLEAGLINEAQVKVALNDQQATGMKFGEVLVTRGWIKQQTVEFIMKKVVVPERRAKARKQQKAAQNTKRPPSAKVSTVRVLPVKENHELHQSKQVSTSSTKSHPTHPQGHSTHPQDNSNHKKSNTKDSRLNRRDAPITKPLPSVNNSKDDDVSWVG